MFRLPLILFALLFACGCKKEQHPFIYGTVIAQGCYPNAWIVTIDQPDAAKYSFLCAPFTGSETGYNCSNAAAIMNMPSSLAQAGKRIRFSEWEDQGLLCLSSNYGTHHLKAKDVQPE